MIRCENCGAMVVENGICHGCGKLTRGPDEDLSAVTREDESYTSQKLQQIKDEAETDD